jgi:hypothetical protein
MRAGHARTDITPASDCPLLGYDQRAEFFSGPGNGGVLDPLRADVLVVESGGVRTALVSLDLCILETPCADHLRQVVGKAAGAPPAHVVLACSHTHSGPYPWRPEWICNEPVPDPLLCDASRRYADTLEERLVEAAARASHDLCESTTSLRHSRLAPGYCRRVPAPDGRVRMLWDLREWDGPEPPPCGDDAFLILKIERDSAPEILLWNAAAHAVVLGKRSNVVSADWPGAVRARIESARPGSRAMFLHGAGGDVHPWLATGCDPSDLETVATPAASLAVLLARTPPTATDTTLAISSSDGLTALRLGPARILALPCEMFGRTGAALRREFPDLLLATTANGWNGYWPPAECFPEGGHEVTAALAMGRKPGDCESLVEKIKTLVSLL